MMSNAPGGNLKAACARSPCGRLMPWRGPFEGIQLKRARVLRCRYSNSDQLRDLLGQLLHDLDQA
jgi:hypothetical protein